MSFAMAGSFKPLAAVDTLESGTTEAVRSATARDRNPSRTTFTIVAGIAIVAVVLVSKASSNVGPEDVNEQGVVDVIDLYNASNSGGEMSLGQKLDKSLQLNQDGVSTGRMARNMSMESQAIQNLSLKYQQINVSYKLALRAQRDFVNAKKLGKFLRDTLQDLSHKQGANMVVDFLSTKFLPNVDENSLTIENMIAAIGEVKAGIEAAMQNGLINFLAPPVADEFAGVTAGETGGADEVDVVDPSRPAPPAVPLATSPRPPTAADRFLAMDKDLPTPENDTSMLSTDAPTVTGPTEPNRAEESGGDAEIALAQAIAAGMEKIIACVLWAVEGP